MAELWEGEISDRTISRGLKKIGFTRKKTYGYRQRDDEKRFEFSQKLSSLDPHAIVYADEYGMDERDDYGYGYTKEGERFRDLKSGGRNGYGKYDCNTM
jgi:hypothetical protein